MYLWLALWDELIRRTGVEEALTDMALRPQYVHAVVSRLVEAYLKMMGLMRGCPVEIILKDISILRYDPKRLWKWAEIAMQTAEQYA